MIPRRNAAESVFEDLCAAIENGRRHQTRRHLRHILTPLS
jgi:hypothetical protein